MAAEHYDSSYTSYPRPQHEFGPAYFHPPETVKPRGRHLRLVGQTALAGESQSAPKSAHPFDIDMTDEEMAASLRASGEWLAAQEQKALDAFTLEIPELDSAETPLGAAIFEVGAHVVEASAFKSRRVETEKQLQVDFLNGSEMGVKINEKVGTDGKQITIVDAIVDPSGVRQVEMTVTENNPDAIDIKVINTKDVTAKPVYITDAEAQQRFTKQVLSDVANLVGQVDAGHNPLAAQLARKDLHVAAPPALSAAERRNQA